jgi:hypothetical protein
VGFGIGKGLVVEVEGSGACDGLIMSPQLPLPLLVPGEVIVVAEDMDVMELSVPVPAPVKYEVRVVLFDA